MRCVVKASWGAFYGRIDGKPAWVESKADALVLPTKKHARGLVRILADRRIKATVEKAT
jgi:hypothetical protein